MAQSSWKFNYIPSNIYKNIFLNKFKQSKIVKIYCRSATIPKLFLKKTIAIYKGNLYTKILFTKHHVGFKSGEFSVTRKPFNFPIKNKKDKR